MMETQRTQRRRLFLLVIGPAVLALAPAGLFGQETPQLLEIRADAGKTPPAVVVSLRPNTPTTLALTLQNPGEEELRNIVVKLVQIDGAEVRTLAQTQEVEKLPAKGKVRLAFPKGKDKKDKKEKEADPKKDKDAEPKLELTSPPFKVQLWVEARQAKEFITIKNDVQFVIKEPRDYVTAHGQYDQAKRKATFKVKFGDGDNITGPNKCPIQLVLGPELEPNKKGTYRQLLTDPKQAVELFAEDLAFAGFKIAEGHIYLTVDGYERAFAYPVTLAGSGDLDELPLGQKIGARIRVPRFAKPQEKFPVVVEMDGPTGADFSIEIALDRAGMKEEFETKKFTGLRQQNIGLTFSAAGDLICNTRVRDWQTEFDTTGVYGNMLLRVSVYKKDELVALLAPKETRPLLAAQDASADGKRLFARVTQDDTPPQDMEFVNLPKEWYVGRRLPVYVRARLPDARQAPIEKKVIFFRGKAAPDGKINPEAIVGFGEFDPDKAACIALLPAPEKAEPLELSVQFMTAAGVPGVKTASIAVKEAKFGPAKIKGKVAHGTLGQPDLDVTLADEKGKPLAKVKTNAKGEFVFDKVLPGNYVIYATVNFPALVGVIPVEVPEGKELIDNVAVRLLAK